MKTKFGSFNCLMNISVFLGLFMFLIAGSGMAEDFNLDELIKSAKTESGITIYSSTSKIKKAAKAFTKKYGIEAVGTKIKGAAQIEAVVREAKSGNIVGDVIISSDAGATLAQLLGSDMVSSWTPPDQAAAINDLSKDPLVVWRDPSVWSFNNENTDVCPVNNIWELAPINEYCKK